MDEPNPLEHGKYGQFLTNNFEYMPIEFQIGVYQLFFDSIKMSIYVKPMWDRRWSIYIDNYGTHVLTKYVLKIQDQKHGKKLLNR
jgi:hypothetical protein